MIEHVIVLGMLGIYGIQDIRKKEISIGYLPIFVLLGVILLLIHRTSGVQELLLGMGVGMGMLALSLLTKGSIGIGDGLLLLVSGIFLGGNRNFMLLMYGMFYAAVYSLGALLFRKKGRKQEIPFIPFLFAGCLTMFIETAIGGGFA